jgi:hypothetical protein
MESNQNSDETNGNLQDTGNPIQPDDDDNSVEMPDTVYISWTAKEFIEHKKTFGWYILLAVGLAIISIAVYFIVHSIFPVIMILLIGVAFAVIAGRHPRSLNYELNNVGVLVGERSNSYNEFKSFSVIDEGNLGSIVFNPFKRFVFPTIIYYDLKDEEKIVNILSNQLPIMEPINDPIDQLMRRLRF